MNTMWTLQAHILAQRHKGYFMKTSKATVKRKSENPQNIITPKKLNAIKFQTYYEQVVSDHYNEGPSMVRQHLAQYGWTEYFKDIKLKKTDKIRNMNFLIVNKRSRRKDKECSRK